MTSYRDGIILLEDGTAFRGRADVDGSAFGEVVFNTSMTGYQEILTDPSYRRQIVVMTQPHIGNYGTQDRAAESRRPWVEAFVARRFTKRASGTAHDENLLEYLTRHRIPALSGIDTRALVRHLRDHGAMRGVVSSRVDDLEGLRAELAAVPEMTGLALVDEVTCEAPWQRPATRDEQCHVVVYDFGTKGSIIDHLADRGARVTVVPARTPAAESLRLEPDGIVLSNGPGDPAALGGIIESVRDLTDSGVPMFGICLGHQLLALALGARTFKLKFGHHGGNQPVADSDTGRVRITSQNHGFAVDPDSLPSGMRVTHTNLNDGTVEGFIASGKAIFSVQYHPEAAPGPRDGSDLFDRFLDRVRPEVATAS